MAEAAQAPRRALGKSGIDVSAIGVGTNRWRQGTNDGAVQETYAALLGAGIDFVDTAEVYGFGKSERLIGDCLKKDARPVIIASKFAPFVARTSVKQMLAALDASLARLGRASLDLYYIHFPFPFADLDALADGLVEAVKSGKVKAVGVSNFSAAQMRRAADRLGRAGVALAANEVHYSLLNRKPETNGVLDACKELDVALVAYFPLASGRLTSVSEAGKNTPLETLQATLARIGADHDAPAGQVALNWLLKRDPHVIPIPGASKARHATENAAALSWSLSDAEFAAIDAASQAATAKAGNKVPAPAGS
jgi:aryl-alcohol dehydrogenase-like predicted oxidoreductase